MWKGQKNNMTKIAILDPCPCGSGINFENCCQPCLLGLEKPASAEKLLRSRYSAFVAKNTDYIFATHHPEKIKTLEKQGIIDWANNAHWLGLELQSVEISPLNNDETVISFIARYTQDNVTYNHRETSLFKRKDGVWYFYDVQKNTPIKLENKTGRNDPCPCGSGKKFKKCCGA